MSAEFDQTTFRGIEVLVDFGRRYAFTMRGLVACVAGKLNGNQELINFGKAHFYSRDDRKRLVGLIQEKPARAALPNIF